MKFKEKKLKAQFYQLHYKLRFILTALDFYSIRKTGKEIFITSLIRPKKNDSGIHALKRASDIRTEKYYTLYRIGKILRFIDDHFLYDPKRPRYKIAIYHKVKKSTWHLHIQVHNRTKIIWLRNY